MDKKTKKPQKKHNSTQQKSFLFINITDMGIIHVD